MISTKKKKNQNLNSLIFMVIIKRCLLGLCLCVNLTILAFKKKKKSNVIKFY